MAKLNEKYDSAQRALKTLQEILDEPFSPIIRDAAIQRFEYTFEICWKTLQAFLKEREGIVANSPKSAFREALSTGILNADEVELSLEMTDDRNMTTYTYIEEVAVNIYKKLLDYHHFFEKLLNQMKT